MSRRAAAAVAIAACILIAGCAQQVPDAVEPGAPGFLLGLWHGFSFPVAWVLSLFVHDWAIYAVPNNGGWYDFGFFVGIMFFGVGSHGSRTVYRTRTVYRDRPAKRGNVIDHE